MFYCPIKLRGKADVENVAKNIKLCEKVDAEIVAKICFLPRDDPDIQIRL